MENTISEEPTKTDQRLQTTRLQANNVYEYKKKQDTVTYLHKTVFSPVKSTWIKVINAGFSTRGRALQQTY